MAIQGSFYLPWGSFEIEGGASSPPEHSDGILGPITLFFAAAPPLPLLTAPQPDFRNGVERTAQHPVKLLDAHVLCTAAVDGQDPVPCASRSRLDTTCGLGLSA
jgi:hypothetical protein